MKDNFVKTIKYQRNFLMEGQVKVFYHILINLTVIGIPMSPNFKCGKVRSTFLCIFYLGIFHNLLYKQSAQFGSASLGSVAYCLHDGFLYKITYKIRLHKISMKLYTSARALVAKIGLFYYSSAQEAMLTPKFLLLQVKFLY